MNNKSVMIFHRSQTTTPIYFQIIVITDFFISTSFIRNIDFMFLSK